MNLKVKTRSWLFSRTKNLPTIFKSIESVNTKGLMPTVALKHRLNLLSFEKAQSDYHP